MLGIPTNGKGSYDVVHVDYVSCLNCFRKMLKINRLNSGNLEIFDPTESSPNLDSLKTLKNRCK